MATRLVLFIQALFTFFLGIYLSFQGLPSDEVSLTQYAGNQIVGALDNASNNPEVHKASENINSSLSIAGFLMTLISVLEMVGLGISLFKNGI